MKNKTKLHEAVSLLLIAIKNGDITVFPAEDNTPNYIQLLENCNKNPLLTYHITNNKGDEQVMKCYDNNEINNTLHIIQLHEYMINKIEIH